MLLVRHLVALKLLRSLFAFTFILSTLLLISVPAGSQTKTPTAASPFPAPTSAAVQPIPLLPSSPGASNTSNRKKDYKVTVSGGDWQATGVQLLAGDQAKFQASGSMTLSDAQTVKPSGNARDWRDLLRIYPLNSANRGALIGRIGSGSAALPFLIGDGNTLTAPTDGQLYLRANLSTDLTADGDYEVTITLQPAKAGNSTALAEDSKSFSSKLSPALFDDIPRRVVDQSGDPGDMVNFAMVGTEAQVKAALAKAAWVPTDANPKAAVLHGLLQVLQRDTYMAVPMSTLYLFGRPQDMAYARGEAIKVAATRNHMRIWKTTKTVDNLPLWVGSSTHDNGFEKDQRNGGVTHHIDPDIDQERDFILSSLIDVGAVKAAAFVRPSNPVGSAKTATGGSFHSDGRIVVMLLQ